MRATILRFVREGCGNAGATCDDIEYCLGMLHQTASARIYELRRMCLLVDSGWRRLTRSGRKAAIWIVPSVQFVPETGDVEASDG